MHPHGPPPYELGGPGQPMNIVQKLAHSNEQTWIAIGLAAESMEDYERAIAAYDSALRHNPYSVPAMSAIAGVHRTLDRFEKAVDYFQRVLNIVPENGETWGAMGHCYLMMDDLQKAYTAYQQALYHLPNPKEPKLWYGIGILYDRYGSLEHAEEAFASVVHMDPDYEKANEIYFRLGIIYKQQNKYQASLECFRYILNNPPRPLTEVDIWFQIGHVYEQQKEFGLAKEAYERVLSENPSHAKVLQQLGWLYHQSDAGFENQEQAIHFLTKSLESDPNDAQSWYLLGRAYMAGRNYNKAYEAYQQAVYRDGKNPTFWCSIGVLYYQISQYRDALDAYSRAIRLNPYISEVWFDLGSLYESCNNQVSDAIDAYVRAAELDPDNPHIQQRLTLLRNAEARGEQVSSVPMPQDVHPTAYANHPGAASGPPGGLGGSYGGAPPLNAEGGSPRMSGPPPPPPHHRGRGGSHSPSGRDSFGEGAPAIPNIDDRGTKGSSHTTLAPMETPGAMHSPPHGSYPAPHYGRTSPRAQALSQRGTYGGGMEADYEMRERELEWERENRERMHGRGDGYGNGYSGGYNGPRPGHPPPRFETYGRRPEMSEQEGVASLSRSAPAKGGRKSGADNTGRGKGKAGSRAVSPAPAQRGGRQAPVAQAPPSPGSDSSTGSNQPLAAKMPPQAPAQSQQKTQRVSRPASPPAASSRSRLVDEDYDEGAADALMGLAGAASASAQITAREESKQIDTAPKEVAAGERDKESTTEKNAADIGHKYPSSISVDTEKTGEQRLAEVKARADSAAKAEDEVEHQLAKQQAEEAALSRKREASREADAHEVESAKRMRSEQPDDAKTDKPAATSEAPAETAPSASSPPAAAPMDEDAPATTAEETTAPADLPSTSDEAKVGADVPEAPATAPDADVSMREPSNLVDRKEDGETAEPASAQEDATAAPAELDGTAASSVPTVDVGANNANVADAPSETAEPAAQAPSEAVKEAASAPVVEAPSTSSVADQPPKAREATPAPTAPAEQPAPPAEEEAAPAEPVAAPPAATTTSEEAAPTAPVAQVPEEYAGLAEPAEPQPVSRAQSELEEGEVA